VVVTAAQSLATRFNPEVGCIRSWSWGSWQFPVIIDNMMNLEILFWASKNGGQAEWYDMAESHAAVTMENHVRPDGSTWHVVDYNPDTGEVIEKSTWQGYQADSTWARGQAWALYGFTMAFRETDNPEFLDTARRTADYFIDNVPEDHVPYWDFQAPGIPDADRDTSAAAIAASGLLELSTLTDDEGEGTKYYNAALDILTSLCTTDAEGGYLAEDAGGFPVSPGILMRGCQVHPDSVAGADQCDESLIWGDYYFIEALMRFRSTPSP
jgi:unsaturated chondroitin disaccharide hydrolase